MGAAPRKRHGQHFLLDDNLLSAIVRDAGVREGETVLEIGPGPGLLTRHLLHAGATVRALEIDPAMGLVAGGLIEAELSERLTWVEADALAGGRRLSEALVQLLPGCARLVANLPYGISGPLLGALLTHPDAPTRWMVMVQREMGQRLVAEPSTRDYGPLAVLVASAGSARIRRKVPGAAFWPRPEVASVVVEVALREDRPGQAEADALQAFLGAAFHNRRKTLVNSLVEASGSSAAQVVAQLGPENSGKTLRAEALPPVKLCALARTWAGPATGGPHRP